jgi:hypothetical protein
MLFVVNAGSDSFSQFEINRMDMTLSLLSINPTTNGRFPCSLDGRVDVGTISGYNVMVRNE